MNRQECEGWEMARLRRMLERFLRDEDGPTAVEYAVMLALIFTVCVSMVQALGTNANATFTSVSNTIGSTAS